MLSIQLALLKGITISAISLQLTQPIVPAGSNPTADLALPSLPKGKVNASPLSDTSGSLSPHWDGTIEVPFNEPNISISFLPSDDLTQVWNDTYSLTPNISTVSRPPRRAHGLPPLPYGWEVRCSEKLGSGMNPSSCLDAWKFVPPIDRKVSFGPRSAANTYDVGLPRRYLSCTSRGLTYVFAAILPWVDAMLTILQSRWYMLYRALSSERPHGSS